MYTLFAYNKKHNSQKALIVASVEYMDPNQPQQHVQLLQPFFILVNPVCDALIQATNVTIGLQYFSDLTPIHPATVITAEVVQ